MSPGFKNTERILIVDDEPSNLKLLDKMLRGHGFHGLDMVVDSRLAIAHYQAARPDLILLDINMPHLDGYQVMEQFKALNDPLMPPVVILSAQSDKDYLRKALASGARDYITKPFDHIELLMRVRNLLDAQRAHRMIYDQKNLLEKMVQARTEELLNTRLQIVRRLGMAAEYRDAGTGSHILRMSHIAAHLARASDWSDADCELLLNASPMHDIGKIGIPDAILLKPGRLEPYEWVIMKTHAQLGGKLLEGDNSSLLCMAREIAYAHHEKWDGSGYPNGLSGYVIPQAARITALADVFDALTSERPYKKSWTMDAAVELIESNSGKHFDPELSGIFLQELPAILKICERFNDSHA